MGLQVTINGRSEAIVKAQLARGQAGSPEEVVERALDAYAGGYSLGASSKSPKDAVADILALREAVELGGLKAKDLAHEGHKY
jgi:hypothetical protein